MRNLVFVFLLSFIALSACKKQGNEEIGLKDLNTFDNPGNLNAYYYSPINASENMPLVVVLHGCTQTAKELAELSDWNKLADEYGFYLLYPEQKILNNTSRCFNWFLSSDNEKNKGENASIKAMINEMQSTFNLNAQQTYITGLSAGGAMSVVMVSSYPELFQASAIMSAGPYKSANNAFESIGALAGNVDKTAQEWKDLVRNENLSYSGEYPKMAIFHGKNDNVVDFKNAHELTEQWTSLYDIDINNGVTINNYLGIQDITRVDFFDLNSVNQVSKFEIDNMGHALAINPGDAADEGGKEGTYGKDKNFFSSYYAAQFFNLIP